MAHLCSLRLINKTFEMLFSVSQKHTLFPRKTVTVKKSVFILRILRQTNTVRAKYRFLYVNTDGAHITNCTLKCQITSVLFNVWKTLTESLYSNTSPARHFWECCLVDDLEAGDTDNGHGQKIDSVNLRWKCNSFATNHQIPCPLKNANSIVVYHPGLKQYSTMNVKHLVHALTTHYNKLYVSCRSHFYSLNL